MQLLSSYLTSKSLTSAVSFDSQSDWLTLFCNFSNSALSSERLRIYSNIKSG